MNGFTRKENKGDKDFDVSWQEVEIARLTQQLHDLSSSTSAQLERDSEEIKQMRTFIEELNEENHQLINDLQDCMEEYEKLRSSASDIEKDKAALVKLNILVTEERDELAERLERIKEPDALEAHHMIQDIRDVCNRKIKDIKSENAQLEKVMRLQKSDLDHLMEDMMILARKDAHNERRLRFMENFIASLHGGVERSLELNKSLESVLNSEDDQALNMSKSILQKQHDALLHIHTALQEEVLSQKEGQLDQSSPRLNQLLKSPRTRSKSTALTYGALGQLSEISRSSSMPGGVSFPPHTVEEITSVTHRRQERSKSEIIHKPQYTDSLGAIFQSVRNLIPSKGMDASIHGKMFSRFSLVSSKSCSSGISDDLLEDFATNRIKIDEIELSDTESTVDSTPTTALDIRTNQDNDDDVSGFF
jgi:hypothetical protein